MIYSFIISFYLSLCTLRTYWLSLSTFFLTLILSYICCQYSILEVSDSCQSFAFSYFSLTYCWLRLVWCFYLLKLCVETSQVWRYWSISDWIRSWFSWLRIISRSSISFCRSSFYFISFLKEKINPWFCCCFQIERVLQRE